MNPIRTTWERLLLATDGLDPHVSEAILLLWSEEQTRHIALCEAQDQLAEALRAEVRAWERRAEEWEITKASMLKSLDTLQRVTRTVPVHQLERLGYALEWTRLLPEGGLR